MNERTKYVQTHIKAIDKIRNWCLYIALMAVRTAICKFFVSFLWVRMGSRFILDLKAQLFDSLMKNDVSYFDITPIGSVLTLLGEDSQLVQDNFGTTKGIQFQNIGQFLTGIILAYIYQLKLALIATCVFPFAFLVIFFFSKYIDKHINRKFFLCCKIDDNSGTLRGFNREDIEFNRFMKEVNNSVFRRKKSINRCQQHVYYYNDWSNLYYGGTMVDKGQLEPGNLMSVFGFMMFGSMGLIELQTSLQGEQKAISSGSRILSMIAHVPSIPFSGSDTIDDFKGHIVFQNVIFK